MFMMSMLIATPTNERWPSIRAFLSMLEHQQPRLRASKLEAPGGQPFTHKGAMPKSQHRTAASRYNKS